MLWKPHSYSDLESFKQKCLNEGNFDEIFSFTSQIDLEKSGIDDDDKRWSEIRKQDWAVGYTTGEKKLETLKTGGKKRI